MLATPKKPRELSQENTPLTTPPTPIARLLLPVPAASRSMPGPLVVPVVRNTARRAGEPLTAPSTVNRLSGLFVPMPTLPPDSVSAESASVPAESAHFVRRPAVPPPEPAAAATPSADDDAETDFAGPPK